MLSSHSRSYGVATLWSAAALRFSQGRLAATFLRARLLATGSKEKSRGLKSPGSALRLRSCEFGFVIVPAKAGIQVFPRRMATSEPVPARKK
jgi:hypothetical protein